MQKYTRFIDVPTGDTSLVCLGVREIKLAAQFQYHLF